MSATRTEIYIFEDKTSKAISFETSSPAKQGCNLLFTLSLLRVFGDDYKERLNIQIKNAQGAYNGEINCSPLNMESDLYQLREYGTALNRSDVMKLDKIIDVMYRSIDREKDNTAVVVDAERDILDILKLICKYIKENKIEEKEINGEKLYNIPAKQFRDIFKNTDYKNCGYLNIKKALKNNDFSLCATGRNDNTVKIGENNIKVISIRADEPDVMDCFEGIK